MTQRISRRTLLSGAVKTGAADGAPLTLLGGGVFRVGAEDWSPERLRFGPVINGRATRMTFSGVEFHRTFTP